MTMTARARTLLLNQWRAFLQSGLAREKFKKRLYRCLTLYCSFIAHYDLDGFHAYYFRSGGRKVCEFLSQFDARGDCASAELGMSHWLSYGDEIGHAMVEIAEPYIPELMEQATKDQELVDMKEARALIQRANPTLLRDIEEMFGPLAY